MKLAAFVMLSLLSAACAVDDREPAGSDEPDDYVIAPDDGKADGVPPTFDAHEIVDDDVFLAVDSLTVDEIQAFFERSPYGNRSWLADYTIDGVTAAQAVYDAAREHQISPIMLLSRMQVEASLVSKTTKPAQSRIDKALGCGCPDGAACNAAYKGFAEQLACGAKTLRRWYDASVDGTGAWRKGVSRRTLDPKTVTPRNHATASLYQYTPWVLTGRGGNWLVWNVTRKYVRHAEAEGFLDAAEPAEPAEPQEPGLPED